MISKIIVYEETRLEAIDNLITACGSAKVYPVKTNTRFMINCLSHDSFKSGDISTNFIAAYDAALFPKNELVTDVNYIAGALTPKPESTPFGMVDGWRPNMASRSYFTRTFEGEDVQLPLDVVASESSVVSRPEGDVVFVKGQAYLIQNGMGVAGALEGGNALTAPMPGKIIAVNAASGGTVKAGDPLIIMEAMKMEMTLEAPRDGVVAAVNVETDTLVSDGDVLLEMAEED